MWHICLPGLEFFSVFLLHTCRFSVDVFQPPFHSGRASPESRGAGDLPPLPISCRESGRSGEETLCSSSSAGDLQGESQALQPTDQEECAQASAALAGDTASLSSFQTPTRQSSDVGFFEQFSSVSCCSFDPHSEKETSCEKTLRPEGRHVCAGTWLRVLLPGLLTCGAFLQLL